MLVFSPLQLSRESLKFGRGILISEFCSHRAVKRGVCKGNSEKWKGDSGEWIVDR